MTFPGVVGGPAQGSPRRAPVPSGAAGAAGACAGADQVLTVRGLTVRAGEVELVHPLDLDIARGERVGLIGESGCGKTLTALAVIGLLGDSLAARGDVRLCGIEHNLLALDERALSRLRGSRIGMVFQEPLTALNPTMRVGRQVAEVMLLHRRQGRRGGPPVDRKMVHRDAVRLLDDVRLPDPEQAARSYPHQLSGGQRQRVVLAMALANSPDLLICDEPTTALDVTVQANVLDLIVRGVAQREAGLLFISHDLAVIATVCEKVAVMYGGRIVESGPVAQVLAQPRDPYTRKLVASSSLTAVEDHERIVLGDRGGGSTAGTGEPPLIEVRDVARDYRRPRRHLFGAAVVVHALRGVDLTIHRGERVGIVGESGCGKSTLLRILAGLDQPTAGRVQVGGRPVSGVPERRLRFLRESLQMVFQDPMGSLDPRMRIDASVREPLLLLLGREDHRERVAGLLASVGIDPGSAQRYPHQFSGGQRQRISIARAIGPEPDILLADEPVSALDVSVRAQVLKVLAHLVDDLGLTLVFVSHDLSVVRAVCDRVVVMKAGRIVEQGPVSQIYDHPQEPYTRRLVASIPTIERALAGVTAADLAAARAQEHPGEAAGVSP